VIGLEAARRRRWKIGRRRVDRCITNVVGKEDSCGSEILGRSDLIAK